MATEVWGEIYDRLTELVTSHRSTLIFVNTRRLAERVARHLAERIDEDSVTSHHGSLAKEHRLDAERRLKAGKLKALVATASLELGIDIENDLEYSYLTSVDATVAAVYNRDFDIGLSWDDARRTLRKDQPDVGEKVIVFNITDEIPNDVVAVRGELPDDLKQAIYDHTKAYLETEEGELVFDEIYALSVFGGREFTSCAELRPSALRDGRAPRAP